MSHIETCPSCGAPLDILYLHGHEACSRCKVVIHGCCEGLTQGYEGDDEPLEPAA